LATCQICGIDSTDANAMHIRSKHLAANGGSNRECDYCGASIEHAYDVRDDGPKYGNRCEYCRRARFKKADNAPPEPYFSLKD